MRDITHDFTKRGWGHNYEILDIKKKGLELKVAGWWRGIQAGDYLLFENDGDTTRYKVGGIRYESDPSDMFFANLKFAPRTQEEKDTSQKKDSTP